MTDWRLALLAALCGGIPSGREPRQLPQVRRDREPRALAAPLPEGLLDRLPRALLPRQRAPRAAGAKTEKTPVVLRRLADDRGRPGGVLVGSSGASSAHSASFTALGYTGTALPEMPSAICMSYLVRLG